MFSAAVLGGVMGEAIGAEALADRKNWKIYKLIIKKVFSIAGFHTRGERYR